jgi:predicted RNase H-like HicB family nuclease
MYPDYRKVVFTYPNSDGSKSWVVDFPDLPGCSAVGESEEEALRESKIASELWLDVYFENHGKYPEAKDFSNEYSGKLLLRLPKTLHKELAQTAQNEGVSLNSYIVSIVAQRFGERASRPTYNFTFNQVQSRSISHPVKYVDTKISQISKSVI